MQRKAIKIRQEQQSDYPQVHDLIEAAFRDVEESNHREQYLVERLRESEGFVPELSLVAETDDGQMAGYILLTEVEIVSEDRTAVSLAVAPLAVRPEFQRQGVGGRLLREVHRRAALLGYGSAVLLGHKDYYPRFGYRKAIDFGIELPFDVPQEYCMVIELLPATLDKIHGRVHYPKVFQ